MPSYIQIQISNTNACFLVPLGSYSNTRHNMRKGKQKKKNYNKIKQTWTSVYFTALTTEKKRTSN